MAILESNTDLDVKGRVLATTVPNSTGSIVTWNASTKVFGLRSNAQIISDLGLQSSLTQGNHINITGNVISVKPTLNTWIEDSGNNNRILMSTVSSGTNHNDMVLKQISLDGYFKLRNAQDEDYFVYRNTTQEVMFPLVGTSTGTNTGIALIGSNGALWRSNRTIGDFALASQIPTNYITTNTNQTGLTGNKSVDGTWTFNNQINTSSHGNSSQWKQAYDWGDYALNTIVFNDTTNNPTNNYNGLDADLTLNTSRLFFTSGLNTPISTGFIDTTVYSNGAFQMVQGDHDNFYYRRRYGGTWRTWNQVASREWADNKFALASSIITPNDGLLTISTSSDLTGGGTFSADQATASNVAIGLSAGTLASLALADSALQSGDNVSELVNDAGYITTSSLPNVGDGNITYSGIGDIAGGGTSTANQSGDTDYTFDLTAQTKSNIALGVTAHGWGNHSLLNYWKNDYMRSRYVGTSVITDINSALPDGGFVSSYGSTSWAGSDRPSGASYGGAIRFQGDRNNNNNNALDIYYNNGHGGNPAKFWLRTMGQGAIATPWREVITDENLDSQATSLGFIKSSALPTVNNGQLTLSTGTGLSGSANFTANQSGNSSFSVGIASTHKLPTVAEWNALPTTNTITRLRGTTTGTYASGDLTLLAGSNVSIDQSGSDFTINATDTNTTYTAGTGLSLSGTTFGQTITTSGTGTFVKGITQTANGFQVDLSTPPDTTYTAGAGLTLSGTTFSLPITYSGTGNYVSAITQTTNGLTVTRGTLPTAPTVNNGTFTVQGTGSLTGSGSTSANASANTTADLDLSQTTKNEIQQGVWAYGAIPSLIDGVDYHRLNTGGHVPIEKRKTIINIPDGSIGYTINVDDAPYDGYELAINGCGEWSVIVNGSIMDKCGDTDSITLGGLQGSSALFWWSDDLQMWVQAI